MNTMNTESMLVTIKRQREYLNELAEDKKKLIRENERISSELAFNSNSLEKIRKNHISDLIRLMEKNIELESKINEINKKNQSLIDENAKISNELSNEKRKHAETIHYYEGLHCGEECICVKDEDLCPYCRIEGSESKDSFFSIEDFNDNNSQSQDIECIGTRINDNDDEYQLLIEKIYIKKNTHEIVADNKTDDIVECTNTIEIDDTVTYNDIYDENLPLIERIDRCLNNISTEDENENENTIQTNLTNCYHENSITYQLITKDKDMYSHKKNDDNDHEFNYIMSNGKNEYVDNYFSNRL
uniref:Uncharacterized protein n=1 Tax=viral metagenome TaxID=1070528 RepID=A0A6C0DN77_9ZZZZ